MEVEGQQFRNDMLPLKKDVVLHMKYLKKAGFSRSISLRKTASDIFEIWKSADCPPLTVKNIIDRIEKLLEKDFRRVRKVEEARKGELRKGKKKATTKAPKRRSGRLNQQKEDDQEWETVHEVNDFPSPQNRGKSVKTSHQIAENIEEAPILARFDWLNKEGLDLFDNLRQMVQKTAENAEEKTKKITFDEMFYNDQKGERIRKIDRKRLSEEFILEEQKTAETANRKKRRKELACGSENEYPSSSTQ